MSDYAPKDMRVGLRCVAPVKRSKGRELEAVRVVWVSKDGLVVEVVTTSKKKQLVRHSFPPCALRKPGTKTPAIGYVVL